MELQEKRHQLALIFKAFRSTTVRFGAWERGYIQGVESHMGTYDRRTSKQIDRMLERTYHN